jgi:GNAT superfamily N-acetyltransferase
VGTITFKSAEQTRGGPWLDRPEVASFGQLAVDPSVQGLGIGAALMDRVEAEARAQGAGELALDTSEHAAALIATYERRGYRFVGHIDFRPDVNYRSVVLSLALR